MKILTIGHSYAVALNRRLPRELARVGGDDVSITVAAPAYLKGDLRPIPLEPMEGEPYELVALPMRVTGVPHVAHYSPRALGRLMRRERWDVVHAWHEPYVLVGGQVAAQAPRGAALVYSTFQNIPKRYPPPFAQVERYCLRRAAGWTAFGQTIAEAQRDRPGYRDRPMRTIPTGVDRATFRPDPDARLRVRRALGWSDDGPPVIGYLGRFVPEKGLHLLMRCLDALPAGSWRALLVGSGPMESELRDWSARHGDHARVLTGVKHDEVPPHLNAMDLLAAPSQTRPNWREQLGRMLLEAMASGVALVASDSGEIPHVVGDAGRIVPEADEPAWVSALTELTTDATLRQALADRGHARAREVYDWPIVARQFLDFFREVRERPENR
jgi:glycosyltransferase involved in cell wall biosynthesis